MADIAPSSLAAVKPLIGAITKPVMCGEIVDVGEAVYLKSDGKVWLADANAAATSKIRGIVVAIAGYGKTSSEVGDMVDVTFYGPIAGWTGLTPGGDIYASAATVGGLADAAPAGSSGDFVWAAGFVLDAETIFISPYTFDVAAQ